MAAWRFQANNSGLGGTLGVATCHFPGVHAHQTVKWVVKVEFDQNRDIRKHNTLFPTLRTEQPPVALKLTTHNFPGGNAVALL